MISAQPSISTNSMILNGNDMIRGDNIIMPIDISTLATTRSMMRNGRKIRKPAGEVWTSGARAAKQQAACMWEFL